MNASASDHSPRHRPNRMPKWVASAVIRFDVEAGRMQTPGQCPPLARRVRSSWSDEEKTRRVQASSPARGRRGSSGDVA